MIYAVKVARLAFLLLPWMESNINNMERHSFENVDQVRENNTCLTIEK